MAIDNEIADDLTREGPPIFKFKEVGDKVTILIDGIRKSQQTDMDTGKLKTWDNGDPMWQYEVSGTDVATGEPTRVFAKGHMLVAFKTALKEAEAKPEVGGKITLKFDSEGEPPKRGFNAPKLFKARYEAPAPVADMDDL